MDIHQALLKLYGIRAEVEQKAMERFAMDVGEAYPPELREIDEQIAQLEKRLPKPDFSSFVAKEGSSPPPEHVVIADTPIGTTWAIMRFQFVGPHTLHISVPSKQWARGEITPKDFGLEHKSGKPKKQWLLLHVFSQKSGKIPLLHLHGKEKETLRRQLTGLAVHIGDIFPNVQGGRSIVPSPTGDGYVCVFELIPEQKKG